MDDPAPDTARITPDEDPGNRAGEENLPAIPPGQAPVPPSPMGRGFWRVMALIGILLVLIVYCQFQAFTREEPAINLTGTSWSLEQYADDNGLLRQVKNGTLVNATFGPEGGTLVSGRSGCNWYSANTSFTGSLLIVSSYVITTMNCPGPDVMKLESTYQQRLMNVTSCQIRGGLLYLYDRNQKPVLIYDRDGE
ncbi:MAG: META domain-containing protein [Methanoregula sp.]